MTPRAPEFDEQLLSLPAGRLWSRGLRGGAVPALLLAALLLVGCGADAPDEAADPDERPAPVLVESRDEARADADQVEVEDAEAEEAEAEAIETVLAHEDTADVLTDEEIAVEVEDIDAERVGAELRSETGIVGVTGTGAAPTAILRREVGGSLGLVGPPARELIRLSGARVRVEGHETDTPTGPGLQVTRYEILEIGDRVPEVGVLRAVDGATWELEREGEDPLLLEALPTRGMEEGMKIWVVGHESSPGTLVVESHGVIAPARQ